MDKYLSIITNFGCHYTCPYCITKQSGLQIPKTTIDGLAGLDDAIDNCKINIVSISGGGDPLYKYEDNVEWYRKLFNITRIHNRKYKGITTHIPIEMHTSYMTCDSTFPFYDCYRVVYHCNSTEPLSKIKRTGSEKVRAVFVVTSDFTLQMLIDIASYVENSDNIDELSFRQLVDSNYVEQHYLENYLRLLHRKMWYYIEQNDYNIYYAENKIYTEFRKIGE